MPLKRICWRSPGLTLPPQGGKLPSPRFGAFCAKFGGRWLRRCRFRIVSSDKGLRRMEPGHVNDRSEAPGGGPA